MVLEWIVLSVIFAVILLIRCREGWFHAAVLAIGAATFLFCIMMFAWTRGEILLNIAVSGLVCAVEAGALLLARDH
jgi:hypothetical protein